jgi:RPA family protein
MADEQFKRNIAYKLRIEDISNGKPVIENERFSFMDLNGKKIVRVNVVGSIVEKYASEGDKKFLFITIDDGSGQIKLKSFGDDFEKFKSFSQGQTVAVIGLLRYFNNEIYVAPEIVRELNPKYLLARKLELEKNSKKPIQKNQSGGILDISEKDKIIELIKNSEATGGIEASKISSYANVPSDIVEKEIQRLLEEGTIFEPSPGKVRWLG